MAPHILITGGAGFIGSHAARRFLENGWHVTVYDNLSRVGSDHNLDWLYSLAPESSLTFVEADVLDLEALLPHAAQADAVLHAAGQTAVTRSVEHPREDFEINARGTLNVLEAVRASFSDDHNPLVIYTSTNKVYGGMESIGIELRDDHYTYTGLPEGVDETQPLDFHSPYGCSKGTGDQYVRDYARIYGLNTVVFRQSCIYGTWQFGTEDQGWLAHFTIAALLGEPLTIYGDGKQVRDVLFVEDLVSAFEAAIAQPDKVTGQIVNVGGGPQNAISLLDLIDMLEALRGKPMSVSYADWRPGDQRVYVSNIGKARRVLGWQPTVSVDEGVRYLYEWASQHVDLLMDVRRRVNA